MKTKRRPLLAISFLLILASANAYGDVYEEFNIRRPRAGELVCRALIDEFATFSLTQSYRICDNGCQEVVLPAAYCDRHGALDRSWGLGRKTRVAAVGDHFFYQQDQRLNQNGSSRATENSIEVCNARGLDSAGHPVTLRRLERNFCSPGTEIVYWNGQESIRAQVEVVFDIYLTPQQEVLVATGEVFPVRPETEQGVERVIPAVAQGREIEI